jgi:hypothetical protein
MYEWKVMSMLCTAALQVAAHIHHSRCVRKTAISSWTTAFTNRTTAFSSRTTAFSSLTTAISSHFAAESVADSSKAHSSVPTWPVEMTSMVAEEYSA